MIKNKYNIVLSLNSIYKLSKSLGFKKLKIASFPAKADPEKQKQFNDEVLQPLMRKSKANDITLLFMDASHFIMGCGFLGHVYCLKRLYIRTFSGRKRYNVLGAIDFVTKKVHTIANDTYITATEVCEMFKKLTSEYSGKEIHIVLDNARYQKCKIVAETAEKFGIFLDYIPPYSPNLNLIERLWKFVKAELRSKYYNDFDEFKMKINSLVDSTTTFNRDKIDQLIGEKVELFNMIPIDENNIFLEKVS